jgi:phage regulator Rha-like protein
MQKNSNIKLLEIDGEPRVSHRVVAEQTDNQQKNVAELIQKYMEKLKLFGMVPFETEAIKNSKNKVNEQKTYFLNEPQATLLLTFMRNNEIVINFKVDLVRAFFEMRNQLQNSFVEKVEKQTSLEIVENGIQILTKFRDLNPIEQIELDTFHKNKSGESLLEQFGKSFKNSYFLPTELGKFLGMSGAEINLILEKKGFQFRDENDIWRPTENGKEFCLEIGNKFNQLKWKLETIL